MSALAVGDDESWLL